MSAVDVQGHPENTKRIIEFRRLGIEPQNQQDDKRKHVNEVTRSEMPTPHGPMAEHENQLDQAAR